MARLEQFSDIKTFEQRIVTVFLRRIIREVNRMNHLPVGLVLKQRSQIAINPCEHRFSLVDIVAIERCILSYLRNMAVAVAEGINMSYLQTERNTTGIALVELYRCQQIIGVIVIMFPPGSYQVSAKIVRIGKIFADRQQASTVELINFSCLRVSRCGELNNSSAICLQVINHSGLVTHGDGFESAVGYRQFCFFFRTT